MTHIRSYANGGVICIDDALGSPLVDALVTLSRRAEHGQDSGGVVGPATALTACTTIWPATGFQSGLIRDLPGMTFYPTGGPIDEPLRFVRSHPLARDLFGAEGQDWVGLTAGLFRYGSGCGYRFHRNLPRYSGSFLLFLNPVWNEEWGGGFVFRDTRCGTTLAPVFNRLIMVGPHVMHGIARVSAPARRASNVLGGYFMTETRVQEVLVDYFSEQASVASIN